MFFGAIKIIWIKIKKTSVFSEQYYIKIDIINLGFVVCLLSDNCIEKDN